jgi:hypothetical protein
MSRVAQLAVDDIARRVLVASGNPGDGASFFAPGTPLGASSHSNAPAFAISFIEYRFFWKSPQSIRLLA